MRILHLTSKPMLPTLDGGNRASKALYDRLIQEGFTVDYATCFSEKHPLKTEVFEEHNIPLSACFSVDLQVKLKGSLKALLQNQSYHVARFISQDYAEFLELHSNDYDLVLFDGLFSTTPILRGKINHSSQFWLRSHNLEHQIWHEEAANCKNPIKKRYLKLLAKQLESFEEFVLKRMDGVLAIREQDLSHYKKWVQKSYFLPFSEGENESLSIPTKDFYFLGAMNWKPNQDAANQLISEIFPQIQRLVPDAQLHLAGAFMDEVQLEGENFHQHGFVEDLDAFYQQVSILVAPIQTGSGVKIKVLEALKRGKFVLASEKAAEGISNQQYPNLLLCKQNSDYAQYARLIIEDQDFVERIRAKMENLKKNSNAGLNLQTIFAIDEPSE